MIIDCMRLHRELSNYLDGAIEPGLRTELEAHLARCRRCSVLLDTTRKTLQILCDERVFTLPIGFSERLRAFLEAHIEPRS
ncbi:MAG: zf-HC2 domain-containing protein [Acidobacteria bacterium]|nr:zf-HC2 domain-containing protein [Acidobacteriota bacterium]